MPKSPHRPKPLNKTSKSSDNVNRIHTGKGNKRSKSTIQRLQMYKSGNPIRNKDGRIIGGQLVRY